MPKLRYDRKYTKELYHKCIHSYPHYLYARCIHTDLPSRKYIGDANHCKWNTVKRGGWGEPKKKGSSVDGVNQKTETNAIQTKVGRSTIQCIKSEILNGWRYDFLLQFL